MQKKRKEKNVKSSIIARPSPLPTQFTCPAWSPGFLPHPSRPPLSPPLIAPGTSKNAPPTADWLEGPGCSRGPCLPTLPSSLQRAGVRAVKENVRLRHPGWSHAEPTLIVLSLRVNCRPSILGADLHCQAGQRIFGLVEVGLLWRWRRDRARAMMLGVCVPGLFGCLKLLGNPKLKVGQGGGGRPGCLCQQAGRLSGPAPVLSLVITQQNAADLQKELSVQARQISEGTGVNRQVQSMGRRGRGELNSTDCPSRPLSEAAANHLGIWCRLESSLGGRREESLGSPLRGC